jgi:hypothetical protein
MRKMDSGAKDIQNLIEREPLGVSLASLVAELPQTTLNKQLFRTRASWDAVTAAFRLPRPIKPMRRRDLSVIEMETDPHADIEMLAPTGKSVTNGNGGAPEGNE